MASQMPRRRVWLAVKAWLLFAAVAGAFCAVEWGTCAAGNRVDATEAEQYRLGSKLEGVLRAYAYRDAIPALERDFNAGRPLPRHEVDLPFGRAERILVPGERVDPAFAGWAVRIDYSGTPGVFWNRVRALPPPRPATWADRLGAPEVRLIAEHARRLALILCAAIWCIAIAPAAIAGPSRRILAQVALAAAFFALIAWAANPQRPRFWSRPAIDWIAWASMAGLAIACVAAALPARRARRPADRCAQCNYNLTGNVSGICPECSRPTPEELRRRHDAELAPLARAIGETEVESGDEDSEREIQ